MAVISDPIFVMAFAKHLMNMRVASGVTQQELADAVGVSVGMIKAWENARARIPLDHLFRMCRALNIRPSRLVADFESWWGGME